MKVRILPFLTTFTQLTARLKHFLRGWLLIFGLNEGLVQCATVCVKSEVILIRLLDCMSLAHRIFSGQAKIICVSTKSEPHGQKWRMYNKKESLKIVTISHVLKINSVFPYLSVQRVHEKSLCSKD